MLKTTLWTFFIIQPVAEKQNNERGDHLTTSKSFEKTLIMPKNSEITPSELFKDNSFKHYGRKLHPLEAPEYAF